MESVIIKENSFENVKKEIKKNRGKFIIFSSNKDDLNRKILEKEKINILLLNLNKRKDSQKQRNSGLNQVLAKIARKNNVEIGINLDEIIESKKSEKSEIIARLKQNIKTCSKNKVKMKFISEKYKKDIYDVKALGHVLGMPTWMTKNL